MTFPKKVAIAINTALSPDVFEAVRSMEWLQEVEIHLVHVFELYNYGDGLTFNVTFPFHDDRTQLAEAVVSKMKSLSSRFLPYSHKGLVYYDCLFDEKPKFKILKYLKENHFDLVIGAVREKKGIFESSFTNALTLHAPCSVLIVKADL